MITPLKNSIRILLIDDHKSFMEGLAMVINSQSPAMEVVGMVGSRVEALTAVTHLELDLVLMDMDLGDSLSLDFLPELLEKTSAKVLMLTGMRDLELHDRAILEGASGVLLKDESAKVILKAIEKVHNGEIWASNLLFSRVLRTLEKSKTAVDSEEGKIADLTAREREVIKALLSLDGSTNVEIARQLFISTSTLKNHLTTIYSKLDVKNRVQLMKYALQHKIGE